MSKAASQRSGREVPAGPLRSFARSSETKPVGSISLAAELLEGVQQEIASLLESMPPISEDKAWRAALLAPLYDTVKLYSDREAAFRHFFEVVSTTVASAQQVLRQTAGTTNTVETTRQEATK